MAVSLLDSTKIAEPLTYGEYHWNIVNPGYSDVGVGIIVASGQTWPAGGFAGWAFGPSDEGFRVRRAPRVGLHPARRCTMSVSGTALPDTGRKEHMYCEEGLDRLDGPRCDIAAKFAICIERVQPCVSLYAPLWPSS